MHFRGTSLGVGEIGGRFFNLGPHVVYLKCLCGVYTQASRGSTTYRKTNLPRLTTEPVFAPLDVRGEPACREREAF